MRWVAFFSCFLALFHIFSLSYEREGCFFHKTYEELEDLSHQRASDTRKTAKICLSNGIQVFLISDPNLFEASASLTVKAGTWDDPDEHHGMAHFVEHLLFLGTKKYPRESDFSQYILERGGQYNAFTKHDRTSYGFSIPSCFFSDALDRLSHFFIDPLFSHSAIQREIHAVCHEFEDSIENDALRVWRILKESGNPDHPNHKLSCGNFDSLFQVNQQDIIAWFHKYYQPNRMRLVLMAKEPIEMLAEKADYFFGAIPCEKQEVQKDQEEGFLTSTNQRGHFIYVKPSFKNRSLFLTWEIPSFFLLPENNKAIQLVQMALDHAHFNSLYKILEKESLVREVYSDFWKISQNNALFTLNIVLTDEGISQYEKVLSRCFQALHRLKQLEPPSHLLKKLQDTEKLRLTSFLDSGFDYVMRISSELLDEDIRTYPEKTYTVNEEILDKIACFMDALNPFDCVYFLVANPEEIGIKLSRIEKWMGSEYCIRKIDHTKLDQWHHALPHPLIGFPPEDPPLPSQKNISYRSSEIEEKEIPEPVFIIDNSIARIRWIDQPEVQSIDAFFCVSSPLIGKSAKYTALNEIFVSRLEDSLKETFFFNKAVSWNLEMEGENICLFFSLPKNNYVFLVKRIFSLLKENQLSFSQFEKIKKKKLDAYIGDPLPLDYAHQILDSLIHPFYYTKMELYHSLLEITFEDYEIFQRQYFHAAFVEGAFLGGMSKAQILDLWQEISSILQYQTHDASQGSFKKFQTPSIDQSYFILQRTHRKGNALLLFIETSTTSKRKEAIHKLINIVLHSEFFEGLRTKQQTAYKLHTWNEVVEQRICHCFGVQSSNYRPLDLLEKVEEFLQEFSAHIVEILPFDRFSVIQSSLILGKKKQKYYMENSEDIAFIEEEISTLEGISYESVLEEIRYGFSKENRKRIAILIEGASSIETSPSPLFYDSYLPIEKEQLRR